MHLADLKREEYEFDRDIAKGPVNPRTGKPVAEKVIKYLDDKLRAKVSPHSLLHVISELKSGRLETSTCFHIVSSLVDPDFFDDGKEFIRYRQSSILHMDERKPATGDKFVCSPTLP